MKLTTGSEAICTETMCMTQYKSLKYSCSNFCTLGIQTNFSFPTIGKNGLKWTKMAEHGIKSTSII